MGWIALGGTAGRMGAATNQGADERHRKVRNSQVSARNSAPGVGTSLQDAKKASRNCLSRLALRMSGRLDSNQRPPEPRIGGLTTWITAKSVRLSHPAFYGFHLLHVLQGVRLVSRLVPGFPGYSLPFPATVWRSLAASVPDEIPGSEACGWASGTGLFFHSLAPQRLRGRTPQRIWQPGQRDAASTGVRLSQPRVNPRRRSQRSAWRCGSTNHSHCAPLEHVADCTALLAAVLVTVRRFSGASSSSS
jgi:hypothetical protein